MESVKDTYKTIDKPSEGLYKDKGSKFIAYAFGVESESHIEFNINEVKKQHFSARHCCWAYRLGVDGSISKSNDDGEPSNTAGKPILGQIVSKDLTNILIIVVRYFGGTLLGTGGLIQAYKLSASDAINNASIIEKIVEKELSIQFAPSLTGSVMRIIKQFDAKIISQQCDSYSTVLCKIRLSMLHAFTNQIESIHGTKLNK